ncbi:MAG: LamG domain-containing protein [Bryobacterales bacterium]|nr:LamG domain-containing protein [Bryobacterales bacterium]
MRLPHLATGTLALAAVLAVPGAEPQSVTWIFDRPDRIGGHPVTLLGHPRVIDTPAGKAVQFNGVDDALFIDTHPLAGAAEFTWEAIFRPDGGRPEQRWFHLAEQDPQTGADTGRRMLFEVRIINGQWCLDSYVSSGGPGKALMDRKALHPLKRWYHVAAVYDGREFRTSVTGVREGAGEVHLTPQGAGHTSVGVRINKVDYFMGAVRLSRFTRRALAPAEFLKPPNP